MLFGHGPIFRDLNAVLDPQAVAVVLASGVPVILIPHTAARQVLMTGSELPRNFGGVRMDEVLALLQWPAMVLAVVASWPGASTRPGRPRRSCWIFLLSNVPRVAWGAHTNATALVVMQFCGLP